MINIKKEASDASPHWHSQSGIISLHYPDGNVITPSADEIYKAEFKQELSKQLRDAGPPSGSLRNIIFSRYPLRLLIRIEASQRSSQNIFVCRVYGVADNTVAVISEPMTREADHVIVNHTWYPFARGALDAIHALFSDLGIPGSGLITLKQYLALLGKKGEFPEIQDETGNAASAACVRSSNDAGEIPGFTGKMYGYQLDGYRWLSLIAQESLGCILADQMGLGKTIQVIALLAAESGEGRSHNLVVAPATLLENWRRELERFAPSLKVLVHQGSSRTGFYDQLKMYDVVISSYETVVRDMSMFDMVSWNLVILDEAQAIKNPDAQRTNAIKKIPRRVPIVVTGTPVENTLADLWSLFDFALPGLLGTLPTFMGSYENSEESASRLEPLISPVMLRRKVADVAKDLPERLDIPQPIEMDDASINSYEQIRTETAQNYGAAAGLVSLNRLRMFCAHPSIADIAVAADPRVSSQKYVRLLEILDEIFQNGEKALIFTSYNGITDLMVGDFPKRFIGVHVDFIDGRVPVPDRQSKVDIFADWNGPGVLILNPRAAGTGLNIVAANHVIHFNPEWNPAVEDQATARAHRRGQDRVVTVHRLFYVNTVEEAICDRLDRKRIIANTAVVGVQGGEDDYDDIVKALRLSPTVKSEE
jgi:SNF2 family DNA or RNA helicase